MQITELVTDYLEGRMPLGKRMMFRLHVGMCKHCKEYLRQTRLTVATLGKMPQEPIPADVRDELLRRFRTWNSSPVARRASGSIAP